MQCGNNVPCIIYHITHHITSYNIELLVCLHNSTGGIETAAIAAPVCEGSVSMFARVLALNKAKKVRGNQIARGSQMALWTAALQVLMPISWLLLILMRILALQTCEAG